MDRVPNFNDVHAAANRLYGVAVRTPLLAGTQIDLIAGMQLFLKAENQQRTGSFKFRGAYNALASLDEKKRRSGIVASSSGNHAQGVAEAARLLGIAATIVMPSDAPVTKLERTRRSGAKIVLYDREKEDRDAVTEALRRESGATLIHPYENTQVIAGQGTCGLEIAEQMSSRDMTPDRVLVCTGGGGLTAGVCLAVHKHFPDAKIHCVEPFGFDDTKRSLESGSIKRNERNAGSVCDALLAPSPGKISLQINRQHIESGLTVTDQQAMAAVRIAFEELKMVLEPGGAVALAAVLANSEEWAGENVVCVLTGGNVDPAVYAEAIGAGGSASSP